MPHLFNIVLDKVVRKWKEELKNQGFWRPLGLGRTRENIEIYCFAFADDMAMLSDDEATTIK